MKTRVTLRSAAAAIALTVAATGAQANDFLPDENSLTGTFTIDPDGSTHAGVGSRNVSVVAPNPPGGGTFSTGGFSVEIGTDKFVAWCLDLFDTLDVPALYEVNNANPFDDGEPIIDGTMRTNIKALFDTAYDDDFFNDLPDNNASAGFQLALWEIVYETSGTFSLDDSDTNRGVFYATNSNGAVTKANDYLAGLNGPVTGAGGKGYNLFFLDAKNNERQDLVTVSPVPLPAAGVLMLAALGGLAGSRKLRRGATA